MRRRRLPALFLATLPALAATEVDAEEPDGRFPIWPTEIDRIAAPLRDPALMNESARLAALEELRAYATAVILPDLELALTDPSPEVRNAALQICASRRLLACVDEAEAMWEEGEGSVRLMALELLSQDPTEAHLELIYEAMRDPNDLIREHAINLLVDAPLQGEAAASARQEIVAQLGDVSARVRRTAARGLGRMGPGEGALALVRLLEDIDQSVAEAAAFGLGQLADPRTAPALRRSLENPTNANFASAVVTALARLPGEDIDLELLELLDTPPRNTRQPDIAKAIGQRTEPGPKLIAGLVERMRDPNLREPASAALLWLGDRAVPALATAIERGLEPDIALEVQRLLDARELEHTDVVAVGGASGSRRSAAPRVLPSFDDRAAWSDLLGDEGEIEAAAALGAAAPDWLGGAVAREIDRASTPTQIQPWLIALALASRPLLDDERHAVVWGRVVAWAADEQAGASARCLATVALGRALGTRHDDVIRDELRRLASAHLEDVRGCAAVSLARFGDDPLLEALLADPSPRVRAFAALAHRIIRKPDDRVRTRLALQADRDSQVQARSSAALGLASPLATAGLVLLQSKAPALAPTAAAHWQRFELPGSDPGFVDVPMLTIGGRSWSIVPVPGAVPVEVDTAVMAVPLSPYRYDGYDYM